MLAFEVERNLHSGHASTCKPQCPPHHPSFSAPFSTPTSHRPIVPARSAETLAKSRVVFSDEVYHCLARRQGRNGASSKNDSCIRKRICSFGRPMGWETFRLVHMREPGCSSRRDFRRKAANHGDSHLVSVSPERQPPAGREVCSPFCGRERVFFWSLAGEGERSVILDKCGIKRRPW